MNGNGIYDVDLYRVYLRIMWWKYALGGVYNLGNQVKGGKWQSLAITCTRAVGGVCAHVVGHSRGKPLQITEKCARTRAVHEVVVREGRILL